VWGWVELRVEEPLVDMRMLARRPVLLTNLTALIAGFAMFGTFVLIPNFVETPHGLSNAVAQVVNYGFDASATKAGLYLLPSSIVLLFAGPLAGLLGRRLGFKWPLALGMLTIAAASGSFAASSCATARSRDPPSASASSTVQKSASLGTTRRASSDSRSSTPSGPPTPATGPSFCGRCDPTAGCSRSTTCSPTRPRWPR